jgi:hypothetical protein
VRAKTRAWRQHKGRGAQAMIGVIVFGVIGVLAIRSIYKQIKRSRKERKEFERQLIIDMEKDIEPRYLMAMRINTPHLYKTLEEIYHKIKQDPKYRHLSTS